MERPLMEHIAQLERKIVTLRKELRDGDLPAYQRSERELDMANAEQALALFLKAYELEQKISKLNR